MTTSKDDFREIFDTTLRTAGEAIEDAGYAIEAYKAFSFCDYQADHANFSETDPLEALDDTIAEIGGENTILLEADGSQIQAFMNGEISPEEIIYQNLRGGVDPVEPMVDMSDYGIEEPLPGFGTTIDYAPFPDDKFLINNHETQPPYTKEDARERTEDLEKALENADLNAEIEFVQ